MPFRHRPDQDPSVEPLTAVTGVKYSSECTGVIVLDGSHQFTSEPVPRGRRADLIHPAIPVGGGVHSRKARSAGLICRVWANDFGLFLQHQRPGTASKGAG